MHCVSGGVVVSVAGWTAYEFVDEVHVAPLDDLMVHEMYRDECVCGPLIEFRDEETATAYKRPLVIHFALDGRDAEVH